jgi:lipoprotein-anchoring transpeptidase ErfK/SrfK
MKARRTNIKLLATLLAAVLLALPVMPAFADDNTVTAAVTVCGVSLQGLTASEASDTIVAACAASRLATLPVVASGHVFLLDPNKSLRLDVASTVAAAFASTGATELVPIYTVDAPFVKTFVVALAKAADRKAVDATRSVVKRRLKTHASSTGVKVAQTAAIASVTAGLLSEAAGAAPATVTAPVTVVNPKVTLKNIGKTLIVSLGERKVLLYNGAKLEKAYRCAVGMPRHPTPRGTFKIIAKVKNPSWHNSGAGWAAHMPAYIAPGRNNPLGTRALYLNAPGIRIHGIPASENRSIGHAASHGCIRLKNSNAVDLYPRVPVGTRVYIVK